MTTPISNAEIALLRDLGLKLYDGASREPVELGSVTLHEASNEGPAVTIAVVVSCMPATFWRFAITRANENDDYREYPTEDIIVRTGSGSLTEYWPAAVLVAENSLTIERVSANAS